MSVIILTVKGPAILRSSGGPLRGDALTRSLAGLLRARSTELFWRNRAEMDPGPFPASAKPEPLRTGLHDVAVRPQGVLPRRTQDTVGSPAGDGRMRQVLLKTLKLGEKETEAALRHCWTSTRRVQDMVELLARVEAELGKDAV